MQPMNERRLRNDKNSHTEQWTKAVLKLNEDTPLLLMQFYQGPIIPDAAHKPSQLDCHPQMGSTRHWKYIQVLNEHIKEAGLFTH